MNIGWIKILIAAALEVGWVIGLKHADSFGDWAATIVALIVTSYCLITAGNTLPIGTSYSVFVGLGTAGTVAAEIILFGEALSIPKIVLVITLLSGVIGLKLLTPNQAPKRST